MPNENSNRKIKKGFLEILLQGIIFSQTRPIVNIWNPIVEVFFTFKGHQLHINFYLKSSQNNKIKVHFLLCNNINLVYNKMI